MTSHPATIGPDDTIERAATVMHDKEVSRLPVVEGDRLVGIISRGDIVRSLVDPAGRRRLRRADLAMRPAWAEVDLGAIAANIKTLGRHVAPAQVCAVVKADGYGHGAVAVARAALDAGAAWLGVALAEEGATLRDAGITAPILLLSEPQGDDMEIAVWFGLRPTVYTPAGVEAAVRAAKNAIARGAPLPVRVHLKLDTGMHRVGASPADAVLLADAVATHPELVLDGGVHALRGGRRARRPVHRRAAGPVLGRAGPAAPDAGRRPPVVHAANSAAAITRPDTRFDLVRLGIAMYGIPPAPGPGRRSSSCMPALTLKASVSLVKEVAAGERISYGLRHTFARDSVVATVPIGYADGVPPAAVLGRAARCSSAGGGDRSPAW